MGAGLDRAIIPVPPVGIGARMRPQIQRTIRYYSIGSNSTLTLSPNSLASRLIVCRFNFSDPLKNEVTVGQLIPVDATISFEWIPSSPFRARSLE
jgi:hypothetical protein